MMGDTSLVVAREELAQVDSYFYVGISRGLMNCPVQYAKWDITCNH